MPEYKFFTQRQLDMALRLIGDAVYGEIAPLAIRAWCTHEPVPYAERKTGKACELKVGDKWGALFDSAWFNLPAWSRPRPRASTSCCCLTSTVRWRCSTRTAFLFGA